MIHGSAEVPPLVVAFFQVVPALLVYQRGVEVREKLSETAYALEPHAANWGSGPDPYLSGVVNVEPLLVLEVTQDEPPQSYAT